MPVNTDIQKCQTIDQTYADTLKGTTNADMITLVLLCAILNLLRLFAKIGKNKPAAE